MIINEIKASPEFKEIVDRAAYLKTLGNLFEHRFNRRQPKNMIVKLTKTILDEESDAVPFVRYFLKLYDVYNYLNKNSKKSNDNMEINVLRTPITFKDKKYEYKIEYEERDSHIDLTKIDLDDLGIGPGITYWMTNDGEVYKRAEAQYTYTHRKWQYNQAGNKNIIIKGKTLSYDTLISKLTDEKEIL